MPAQEVPRTDAPLPADFSEQAIREPFTAALAALDMKMLSEPRTPSCLRCCPTGGRVRGVDHRPGAADRRSWGAARAARREAASTWVARETLARIRAGIAALHAPDVAEAFRFANHAMWQQRVHTLAAEARRHDDALNCTPRSTAADMPRTARGGRSSSRSCC